MGKKIGFLLLAAALALSCAAPPLASRQPLVVTPLQFGANEWRSPNQAIIITDGSGTMYEHSTFPAAKALTRTSGSRWPAVWIVNRCATPGRRSRAP